MLSRVFVGFAFSGLIACGGTVSGDPPAGSGGSTDTGAGGATGEGGTTSTSSTLTETGVGGEGLGNCGGIAGILCPADAYCDYESCGVPDPSGTCKPRPNACMDIWAPVCGCDGKTYGNDCDAHSQGVDDAFPGECPSPTGFACGPTSCAVGEYCQIVTGGITTGSSYSCIPVPLDCVGTPSCNCFDAVDVCSCDDSKPGQVVLSCDAG